MKNYIQFKNGNHIDILETSEEPIRGTRREIQPYYIDYEKLKLYQKVFLWFILRK
jgi:hypothetical protein